MRKSTPRTVRDPMSCIRHRMPLKDDQQRDIGIAYRASLQAMLRGHGTEQAWCTLACSMNIALLLAEWGVGAGSEQLILNAQQALLRTRERAGRTGKWAFDGDGMRAVMDAANVHDDQLESATRGQIVAALVEVNRRVMMGETV